MLARQGKIVTSIYALFWIPHFVQGKNVNIKNPKRQNPFSKLKAYLVQEQ
jgi:hypothetical protein